MCDTASSNASLQAARLRAQAAAQCQLEPPEHELSRLLSNETGVNIAPETLRLFIRWHWSEVSRLAHKIHK
jgi:hypothetical protein